MALIAIVMACGEWGVRTTSLCINWLMFLGCVGFSLAVAWRFANNTDHAGRGFAAFFLGVFMLIAILFGVINVHFMETLRDEHLIGDSRLVRLSLQSKLLLINSREVLRIETPILGLEQLRWVRSLDIDIEGCVRRYRVLSKGELEIELTTGKIQVVPLK